MAYAYVTDPLKQIDVYGLSGTCPLAGARQNPWNLFQLATKGQYKTIAERWAAYKGIFDLEVYLFSDFRPTKQGTYYQGSDLTAACIRWQEFVVVSRFYHLN